LVDLHCKITDFPVESDEGGGLKNRRLIVSRLASVSLFRRKGP
jgi:hypothetical protein